MENAQSVGLILAAALVLLFFNALMSRDVFNWVPTLRRQIAYYLLIWLLPIAGILLVNKLANIGWFQKQKADGDSSAVSAGFMEADSVFNPGMKHRIELVEKAKTELHQEQKGRDKNSCH